MLFSKPIKFAEALKSRKLKKLMPTAASSAQLQQLAPEIKERAFFMARVNHAGMVAKTDQIIGQALGTKDQALNPATARAELKLHLQSIGYDPENPPKGFEPAKPGSLRDLSSDGRLNLVLDTNLKMALGYGAFEKANDPDIIDAYPAWELYRLESRKEERAWHSKWVAAGGKLYGGGRMIAAKDDPIWSNLGPFGLPYPPFDYNSGMWTEEIDRAEAEALGVVKPSTIVEPQDRGFNDELQGAVPSTLSGKLLDVAAQFLHLKDGAFTVGPVPSLAGGAL